MTELKQTNKTSPQLKTTHGLSLHPANWYVLPPALRQQPVSIHCQRQRALAICSPRPWSSAGDRVSPPAAKAEATAPPSCRGPCAMLPRRGDSEQYQTSACTSRAVPVLHWWHLTGTAHSRMQAFNVHEHWGAGRPSTIGKATWLSPQEKNKFRYTRLW